MRVAPERTADPMTEAHALLDSAEALWRSGDFSGAVARGRAAGFVLDEVRSRRGATALASIVALAGRRFEASQHAWVVTRQA